MSELAGIKTPELDWQSTDLPTSYSEFCQYADLIFQGPFNNKDPKEKVTYLLLWMGQEGITIYKSWEEELSEDDRKDYTKIMDRFKKHFEPKTNFRVERHIFRHFEQRETESCENFMSRCKTQAKKCKFTDQEREERLIEQLLEGTKYKKVRQFILKDEAMKLDKAINEARTHEASITHMSQYESDTPKARVNVDAMRTARRAHGKPDTNKCGRCGYDKHKQGQKCPAQGTRCNNCSGRDHWGSVCKKPKSKKGDKGKQKRKQVHETQHTETLDDDTDELTFEEINISIDTLDSDERDEIFAELNIKLKGRPRKLKAKVDTGAQGNILPLRIYKQMFPENFDGKDTPMESALTQKKTRITAYNKTQIKHYGTCSFSCRYGENATTAEFYVTEGNGPAIIGLADSRKLKLVELNCNIVQTSTAKTTVSGKEDLKQRFPDRFDGIGKFEGEYHIVVDPNVAPVVHSPRRCPLPIKSDIKKELDKMVEMNVIIPVTEVTDWVSSLAYSPKPNGQWRICLDPKDLNKAIKRTPHHTPTLDEITHQFAGSTLFSKLDARHGYWSVTLDEESSFVTTFNSPGYGRYRFKRLPFGLNISQDVFQQRMDMILERCPGATGIADDVAVYGINEEEHDKNLINLMHVAREYGLVFNYDKCDIKQPSISFFGQIYDKDGVRPNPKRVEAIAAIEAPASVSELQQFLGIATYMSPFIPLLSEHTATLRELVKQDVVYEWTASHQKAFETVKELMMREVLLSYYDINQDTVIEVDASLKGVGAALTQKGRVIAFSSKALTDTERRYANIEREMLAVVSACEKFHMYIYGKAFVVESDHKPLEMIHLKNLMAAPPRLQRMLLRLQSYDVKIKYKPGKEMLLSDGLSRLKPLPEGPMEKETIKVNFVQFTDNRIGSLREATSKDPELSALREVIINGWPEKRHQIAKPLQAYWPFRDELSIEDGLIMKGDRIMIPESQKTQILQTIHQGHQGITKSQLRAKAAVFWININRDIENDIKQCPVCQEYTKSNPPEPLMPHEIPTRSWQVVGTDLFFLDGDEYLLIADYYSKFQFVRKIPKGKSTSGTVINMLKEVFAEHGIPETIISDNGPQYSSHIFQQFAQGWNFKHITSSPRYAQSNGFIERQVQTTKSVMSKAKKSHQDIQRALLCLRTTPIDSVLPSPAELLYGRKIRGTMPVKISNPLPNKDNIADRLGKRQDQQKQYHDRNAHDQSPLHKGQNVRIQDGKRWAPGVVVSKRPEPRSYEIVTQNGNILRRNRRHIKETGEKHFEEPESKVPDTDNNTVTRTTQSQSPTPKQTPQKQTTPKTTMQTGQVYHTRSGRASVKPSKLDI